eukprot:gene9429-1671_t
MDNIITKESLRKLEAFCKQKPNLYPFMVLVHYLKVFLDFVERSKSSTKDIDSAIRFFGRLVKVLLEVVSSSHCVLHAKRAYLWFNFNHQRYICSKDIKDALEMNQISSVLLRKVPNTGPLYTLNDSKKRLMNSLLGSSAAKQRPPCHEDVSSGTDSPCLDNGKQNKEQSQCSTYKKAHFAESSTYQSALRRLRRNVKPSFPPLLYDKLAISDSPKNASFPNEKVKLRTVVQNGINLIADFIQCNSTGLGFKNIIDCLNIIEHVRIIQLKPTIKVTAKVFISS